MPDCGAEWPEAVKTDLEGLEGEWNADDGDCYGKASREVADGGFKASEDPPDDIA